MPRIIYLLPLLLLACQARAGHSSDAPPATGESPKWQWQTKTDGEKLEGTVYRLDKEQSQIDIIVRSEGPLAPLGHDHVVVVAEPEGYFLLTPELPEAHGEIRFAAKDLIVDSPAARKQHEMDNDLDAQAIEGTRQNMLEKVLHAEQWPYITARISELARNDGRYSAHVQIEIHGAKVGSRESFAWNKSNGVQRISGKLRVKQTDFGLELFSMMGGALRVADELEIHYELTGKQTP